MTSLKNLWLGLLQTFHEQNSGGVNISALADRHSHRIDRTAAVDVHGPVLAEVTFL